MKIKIDALHDCLKSTSVCFQTQKTQSVYMQAHKKPNAKCWFLDYPLGINTITPLVKELVHSVGVHDGNFKNQWFRATMATRMYDQNQDEQLIQEFMGHRSLCVRRYKHASDAIKRTASHIIQGAKNVLPQNYLRIRIQSVGKL